jgi:transcription antitermination factor NusG
MWLVGNVSVTNHKKFIAEARPFTTRIYVPMMTVDKVVKHVSKPIKIKRPAFGQYLFLKVRNMMWRNVADCKGFNGYVLFDGSPAVLRPKDIKQIKAFEKINFGDEMKELSEIVIGDTMLINDGVLHGRTGEIVDLLSKRRCIIDVGGMRVTLHIDMLAVII